MRCSRRPVAFEGERLAVLKHARLCRAVGWRMTSNATAKVRRVAPVQTFRGIADGLFTAAAGSCLGARTYVYGRNPVDSCGSRLLRNAEGPGSGPDHPADAFGEHPGLQILAGGQPRDAEGKKGDHLADVRRAEVEIAERH